MSNVWIPGLTLAQSAATSPTHTPVSQASPPDATPESMQLDAGPDSQPKPSNYPPVNSSVVHDGTASKAGDNERKESSESMAVEEEVSAPEVDLDSREMSNIAIPDAAAPSPPSLTSGLEALLGGLDPEPEHQNGTSALSTVEVKLEQPQIDSAADIEGEHPEWEEDSSPYESSDSSSSDDSDDSDDSDADGDYKILGPEETARILMEMEGGSDDDEDGKGKGSKSAGQVKTKNEISEEVIPKPDVEITEAMPITELGVIEHVVENTIVVKAKTTGEYQVLDTGSVLCTENRSVIAAVADLIGSVQQPRYTAKFTNEDELKGLGLQVGSKVFYTPSYATSVFTQALRAQKGTDASNLHDEEVGDDEMEFSDDEKEAEYKRQQKAKKRGGRGGKEGAGGRGGRFESSSSALPTPAGLKYDDEEDDGPYRPLSRPANFGQGQPPQMSNGYSSGFRGGRGDLRGRGSRGRGRGYDRGGRGQHGSPREGHSLPPRPPQGQYPPVPPQQFGNHPMVQNGGQHAAPMSPQYGLHLPQQLPQQLPFAWPQNPPQGFVPPPPPQFTGQGAFFNPAFFSNVQNQMQGQEGNPKGQEGNPNMQWPGHGNPG
ncbi:Gar1/Naf1 RNA binding region-domain-containing protein [Xylariomycetidae sp. FL2044]|nr:Gar1/Naf1 RNA binding region-domain-containing protein [Xylariomycetidae sp. FL2044]